MGDTISGAETAQPCLYCIIGLNKKKQRFLKEAENSLSDCDDKLWYFMICKSCFFSNSRGYPGNSQIRELYRQWTFHRVIYCSNVSELDKEID